MLLLNAHFGHFCGRFGLLRSAPQPYNWPERQHIPQFLKMACPPVIDAQSDELFRSSLPALVRTREDQDRVVADVDHQWRFSRDLLENSLCSVKGKSVLEFGCAFGATAIVLAVLGAQVTAIEVDPRRVELAQINARRYGFGDSIRFLHVPDTTHMPFVPGTFDLVSCNSVLEYVKASILPDVLKDIDRVLRSGGILFIAGTSNRIVPREVHSKEWISNYYPEALDFLLPGGKPQRGLWPWKLRGAFLGYHDLFLEDRGFTFLRSKERGGFSPGKLRSLKMTNAAANAIGFSIGMVMPSICLMLRKP